MTVIIKRDGKRVNFDPARIINAVLKAQQSVDKSNYNSAFEIASTILEKYKDSETVEIHDLQHDVESLLLNDDTEVARAYIEYRVTRDNIREHNSNLSKSIRGLVEQTDISILNENANKDAKVFPVQRDLLAGIVSKHFARNHYLPSDVVKAHDSGDFHYHDMDYSPFLPFTNCCLVDLKSMLTNGFKLGNAQIESPKSVAVACAVTAQIIAQVSSHQYGGTTIA
ncbi:UNVERIFIED_CONTAM: anaerobic ribonucleoside-triphosphate reductase, partial [Kocuria sp. CPCC 205274]